METLKEKDMKIGELYVVKTNPRNRDHHRYAPDSFSAGWFETPYSPVIYLGACPVFPMWHANNKKGWQFLLMGGGAPVMWSSQDNRVTKFETFCEKEGFVFEAVE